MSAPTVQLRFTALPVHVRTARLVAVAVARRAGVDEGVLDEVRLAVGEASARAVDLHQAHCPEEPVTVRIVDAPGAFTVEVADRVPQPDAAPPARAADALDEVGDVEARLLTAGHVDPAPMGGVEDQLSHGVGLAVIQGLVDDVELLHAPEGLVLRMTWPSVVRQAGSPEAQPAEAGTAL